MTGDATEAGPWALNLLFVINFVPGYGSKLTCNNMLAYKKAMKNLHIE
mgnify:CR=1